MKGVLIMGLLNGVKMDKYEMLSNIEEIVLTEKSFIRRLH